MRRDEVVELISRMPDEDVSKIVFVVRGAPALNLEVIFRFEPTYMIFRGRESGTNDDGRALFLPYEEILYIKLERVVTIPQLQEIFGAKVSAEAESNDPVADTADVEAADPADTPAPANLDPAAIAKQNLLARIRAARTSAGVPKPGAK